MEELISKLGINWQSLLFQVINFLILLYVLKRFVYGPIIKVMEERKKRVEASVAKAAQIDAQLERTQEDRQAVLLRAQEEAQVVREKANQDAERIRARKIDETKLEIEELIKKAKTQIQREKEVALDDVRKEAAGLVVLASEKLIRVKLDEKQDAALIEKSVKGLMS